MLYAAGIRVRLASDGDQQANIDPITHFHSGKSARTQVFELITHWTPGVSSMCTIGPISLSKYMNWSTVANLSYRPIIEIMFLKIQLYCLHTWNFF